MPNFPLSPKSFGFEPKCQRLNSSWTTQRNYWILEENNKSCFDAAQVDLHFFYYKKLGSRPSSKSVLIFSHDLILKSLLKVS